MRKIRVIGKAFKDHVRALSTTKFIYDLQFAAYHHSAANICDSLYYTDSARFINLYHYIVARYLDVVRQYVQRVILYKRNISYR